MRQKYFTYTAIILIVTSISPVLAQQTYYFGPAETGVTWQDIATDAWQKTIPQTAITTIAAELVNLDRKTFLMLNKKLVGETAEQVVEGAIKKDLLKATAKKVAVSVAASTALKALTVVGTVETVLEITWPSDINWAARGIPLVCVNSTTDKYPNCFAYFIPKQPSVTLWWDVLDPKTQSFLGQVTEWLLNVPLGLERLLGSPNPRCEVLEPGANSPRAINNKGFQIYNLQPGIKKFFFNCFTPGADLITKVINTPLNAVSTGFKIAQDAVVDSFVNVGSLLYSFLPGGSSPSDVFWQPPSTTLDATLDDIYSGAYVPQWPIPRDVYHTASVVVAVNSPVPSKKPSIPLRPTLKFSAEPLSVTLTQSSILSWQVADADICVASNGWSGNKNNMFGSEIVTPTADTTYTLTCEGEGGPITKSVKVSVVTPVPVFVPGFPPPSVDIKVE